MFYPTILLLSPGWALRHPSRPKCETIAGDSCVFPFTYQGNTHYACTIQDSDNGSPWCAVQVREDMARTVMPGKWDDCSPDCPGYDLSDQRWCEARKLGSWCDLYSGQCHCDQTLPLDLATHCVAPASLLQHCEDDLQCQHEDNNSLCSGPPHSHCVCRQGWAPQDGNCTEGKLLASSWFLTEDWLGSVLLVVPALSLLCLLYLSCRSLISLLRSKQERQGTLTPPPDNPKNEGDRIVVVGTNESSQGTPGKTRSAGTWVRGRAGLYFQEYLV